METETLGDDVDFQTDSEGPFGGFEGAYLHHLDMLLDGSAQGNKARGIDSLERLSVHLRFSDPRRRLITSPIRRSSLVFCFAEALWYASGRDDLEYLAYYAPFVRQFSADGLTLTGTAYGPRIFGPVGGDRSQWDQVAATLEEDVESKRGFVMIALPDESRSLGNPDVACTLGLQYLVRDNRLHAVTYMRANDAYRGCVSDVFSFTFMQELLARQLHLELGTYSHFAGSYHLYASDHARALAVITAPRDNANPTDRMPSMPAGDNRPHIATVMVHEEQLRTNRAELTLEQLPGLNLPRYWQDVLVLFELYRQTRFGLRPSAKGLLAQLPETYRQMMLNRFPVLQPVPGSDS